MKFLIHFGQNSFWYKVILGYNGTEVSIFIGMHIVINRKEICIVGSSDIGIAGNTDGHMIGQNIFSENNSLGSILVSEKVFCHQYTNIGTYLCSKLINEG